jgi:hypothetical protein
MINLNNDDHKQYILLNGRRGGQVICGGIAQHERLVMHSNSFDLNGSVLFADKTISSDIKTGAVIINGGAAIGGNLNVGGIGNFDELNVGKFSVNGIFGTIDSIQENIINIREKLSETDSLIDQKIDILQTQLDIFKLELIKKLNTSDYSNLQQNVSNATPEPLNQNFTQFHQSHSDETVLLSGRPTGQTIYGGNCANTSLHLASTSNSRKGSIKILDDTQTTSTTSGSFQVNGGVGIAKNLYVGGSIHGNSLFGEYAESNIRHNNINQVPSGVTCFEFVSSQPGTGNFDTQGPHDAKPGQILHIYNNTNFTAVKDFIIAPHTGNTFFYTGRKWRPMGGSK